MATSLNVLLAGLVKLLILAGALLYAGLVLMSFRADGRHAKLELDTNDPARSAQRLIVWLGVRALATTLRAATAFLGILTETSAEVGEWFIRRSGSRIQAAFRSRLLL